MNNERIILGDRTFSHEDQKKFSKFSGDKNPIHLDILNQRKTITGECIVHGIHSVLWAIELFNSKYFYIHESYIITFRNKISLNQKVYCVLDKINNKIIIKNIDEKKLVVIKYKGLLKFYYDEDILPLGRKKKLSEPNEIDDNILKSKLYIKSQYGGEIEYAKDLFPRLSKSIDINLIYEVSILSNIVGMQIPGRNSLFASCKIFFKHQKNIEPAFRVKSFHDRLKLVNLEYHGINLNAEMGAYLLKKSTSSKINNDFKNRLIDLSRFDGRTILIIGGSRGIGSFVAKVIGLLGARVTISYNVGLIEASSVCNDINRNTLVENADHVKFNVLNDDYSDVFKNKYDDLFYFPTPKIISDASDTFSQDKYIKFKEIYCTYFENIALEFIRRGGKKIFYPSSIYVEQNINGFDEYKLAKQDGELICKTLGSNYFVKIIVDRLDRVDTDQTLSVLPVPSLDPLEVAIDIAQRMN